MSGGQGENPLLCPLEDLQAHIVTVLDVILLYLMKFNFLSEFTTMAGRRLRDAVKSVLTSGNNKEFSNVHVIIAGLTNTYSQYVTTFEEYQVQRYEVSITISEMNRMIVSV